MSPCSYSMVAEHIVHGGQGGHLNTTSHNKYCSWFTISMEEQGQLIVIKQKKDVTFGKCMLSIRTQ